jgi:hypothetical protein
MMRLLPTNKPFSLKVDISYTNVRFRIDGYILFPLEGQNDTYVHVKNTHRAGMETLKFNILSLEKLGNIKKIGTAVVNTIADNTLQELVEFDYRLLPPEEDNKLGKYIQESEKIIISISDVEEIKEVKKEKKPVIVSLIMEDY